MNIKNLTPKIPEEEKTPYVTELLEVIQLLKEEVQDLRDEIARLKGQKPRHKIKSSSLTKKDSDKQKRGKKDLG